MIFRLITAFMLILITSVSFAKDEQKKLSDEDRKALAKVNFVIVMRKNERANFTGIKEGKPTVAIADQGADFRINIDAIGSTNWTVQQDAAGQGVQVDRKQVMSTLFGKDMTEELKAQVQRALKNIGIYPIAWGGNSVIDNSPYAAHAQVLLRIDLDLPAGAGYKQALKDRELYTIAEIPAAQLYEQVVLGIKSDETSGASKVEVANNTSDHVVGLFSYDKRDDKLSILLERDDMIIPPGQKMPLLMPAEVCSGPTIMVVMMSDATYAEAPMSNVCKAGVFPDLKTGDRYSIKGDGSKKEWVISFYGLHTFKFQKTDGKLEKGRLTGKGWTNFHGDVSVSEYVNGFRHGTGNFCAKLSGGRIDVYMNKYKNGFPEEGYRIILEPNRENKDPTNNFVPMPFEKLYKKLCFWEY